MRQSTVIPEAAMLAARLAYFRTPPPPLSTALEAACDPGLGMDRLVPLRDAVEFVAAIGDEAGFPAEGRSFAEALQREFGRADQ